MQHLEHAQYSHGFILSAIFICLIEEVGKRRLCEDLYQGLPAVVCTTTYIGCSGGRPASTPKCRRKNRRYRGLVVARALQSIALCGGETKGYVRWRTVGLHGKEDTETLVLSTDSDLFNFLKEMRPDRHIVPAQVSGVC